MPNVTFLIKDQKKTVTAESGKTILQIALDNGVAMEHACGGNGFCNTCLCKVKDGGANVSPLNDREQSMGLSEGEDRLGCQATVQGDVTVEVLEL
jgi:2Fe-2S ferredoxin